MFTDITETVHPCEDLAQEIMDKAGAGGVLVMILKRNQPAECIVMLPNVAGAIRAAGCCLRDLAERVMAQADSMDREDRLPMGRA